MRRIIGNQFGTQFVGSGIVPERFVIASAVTQGPSKGEMEQKPVEIVCRHGQRIPDDVDVIDLQLDRPETRETPPCLTVSGIKGERLPIGGDSVVGPRSEERRVGKAWVSTVRSWGPP